MVEDQRRVIISFKGQGRRKRDGGEGQGGRDMGRKTRFTMGHKMRQPKEK